MHTCSSSKSKLAVAAFDFNLKLFFNCSFSREKSKLFISSVTPSYQHFLISNFTSFIFQLDNFTQSVFLQQIPTFVPRESTTLNILQNWEVPITCATLRGKVFVGTACWSWLDKLSLLLMSWLRTSTFILLSFVGEWRSDDEESSSWLLLFNDSRLVSAAFCSTSVAWWWVSPDKLLPFVSNSTSPPNTKHVANEPIRWLQNFTAITIILRVKCLLPLALWHRRMAVPKSTLSCR